MIVFRAQEPTIMRLIFPYLNADRGYDKEIICKEVLTKLIYYPDEICIAVIFKGRNLVGYTIGWTIQNRDFIWLGQSWVKPGVDKKYPEEGLGIVKDWAKEKGYKYIRFSTNRNPRALEKRYGFKLRDYIMESEI